MRLKNQKFSDMFKGISQKLSEKLRRIAKNLVMSSAEVSKNIQGWVWKIKNLVMRLEKVSNKYFSMSLLQRDKFSVMRSENQKFSDELRRIVKKLVVSLEEMLKIIFWWA